MAEQELIATGDRNPTPALPAMTTMRHGLAGFTRQPAVRRALPALGLTGVGGIAIAAWWMLQSPAQAPVFPVIAETDKAAIAQALESAGIPYAIDHDTGTLTVNEEQVHKARMLLAGQGLPKAAPGGDAMLAALPLGTSRAVEGETLRSARAADLARTIEAIDSVKSARVHLAISEPSAFVRDSLAPAASVMLTLQPGRSLSEPQVRAIRHLVASSVSGMSPEQVSVIDQSGALLSQQDGGSDDRAFQLQVQIEDRYRQSVIALLAPMFGRENFSTEVHADVDFTESQSTRETYPKDDKALRHEEGNRSTATPTPPAAIGIPGALSNQAPPATQITNTAPVVSPNAPAGSSPQNAETYARSFDVGREISVTHKPEGHIARVSVAVALRNIKGAKALSPAEIATVDSLVKGAIGFDAQRGDVVAITSRSFVESIDQKISFWEQPWFMPLLRQVGGLFVALLILLFVGRPLLRTLKSSRVTGMPDADSTGSTPDRESLNAADDDQTGSSRPAVTLEMIEAAPGYEARAELVRNFVKQDSERAAMVVRQLVQEAADGQ
jgi:flagellar M-ring protein FliF